MTKISIIAAIGEDGVYSVDDGLPWDIPEELEHFKKVTGRHPLVMGRKTWNSLPKKPLPFRENIVISRTISGLPEGVRMFPSLTSALESCSFKEVFCIGGRELWYEALNHADEAHISIIKGKRIHKGVVTAAFQLLQIPKYWPHLKEVEPVTRIMKTRAGEDVTVEFKRFQRV